MSQTYLLTLKNDNLDTTKQVVKEIKKLAKTHGLRITVRGRMKNREQVFNQYGRGYSHSSANTNDIYLSQREAEKCYAFVLYRSLSKTVVEDDMPNIHWDLIQPARSRDLMILRLHRAERSF